MNDFFANWYELLAYFNGFSNDMYDNNLYLPIGLWMILSPVIILIGYYYLLNSSRFSKRWYWLLIVVVLCAVNFGIAYHTSYNELVYLYEQQNAELPYNIEFFSFSFINALWTLIVSFVFSMIIKWGSKQCRRTPF